MLAPLLACEDSARVTAAAVAEKISTIETARAFPRQHAQSAAGKLPGLAGGGPRCAAHSLP